MTVPAMALGLNPFSAPGRLKLNLGIIFVAALVMDIRSSALFQSIPTMQMPKKKKRHPLNNITLHRMSLSDINKVTMV